MIKKITILLAIIIIVGAIDSYAIDADSLFAYAGTLYEDGKYNEALEVYKTIEQNNYRSAPLFFNIGNCYFELGEPGWAILYYLKARRLDPADDDIINNLEFARQFMPTRLVGVKINPFAEFMDTVVTPFTLEMSAWLASIAFILLILFLALAIHLGMRGTGTKIIGYSLLILTIATSVVTTYKYKTEYQTDYGVIVEEEANIFSAPSEESDLEFVGAFGLTFEIEKSSREYYLVMFENGRKGWINKSKVGII